MMSTQEFISKRATVAYQWDDFLLKYMTLCNSDEYNCETNVEGYINLGTGVNNICNDILFPKITDEDIWICDTTLLQYRECHGILRLRKAFADLMTVMLKTMDPINPNDLFCTTGVTSAIDVLAHCIADPGAVFMVPTPIYGRIFTNIMQRSLIEFWPIPIITETDDTPILTLEKIKCAFLEAQKCGKNVRAIFIINPSNPMGNIYSPHLMLEILQFCNKNNLHIIVDEVYALSVFAKENEFHSVLSLHEIPDPMKTHVLYGISKDFALAGLRVGVIHTKSAILQKCLLQLLNFQEIPFPIMNIAAKLLEDLDWCFEFTSINKKRLRTMYEHCKKKLDGMGLSVHNSVAGFFLWVNFGQKCCISSFEEELAFFQHLIERVHLYIVPGKELLCAQPGWFRISFTGKPHHVGEGLNRLEAAVKEFPLVHLKE